MATTIPELVETSDPPLSTDSDAQFDAKAFTWAASLDPFGQSVSEIAIAARENAEDALAAALGGDLPPLTGKAGEFLRVKADESGAEFAEIPEQSTATWEAGTSTTEGIVSPAKNKAAFDAFEQQIGVGQTWQDVSGSRSAGTTYQNTTGKPIVVCIQARNDASPPFEVSVDNSTWVTLATLQDNTGNNQNTNIFATIPNQHYYRLGSPAGISFWSELR